MSLKLFIEPTYVIVRNISITFVQGAFIAWSAIGFATDKIAFGAVVGAGLSAVWNLLIKPFLIQQGWLKG